MTVISLRFSLRNLDNIDSFFVVFETMVRMLQTFFYWLCIPVLNNVLCLLLHSCWMLSYKKEGQKNNTCNATGQKSRSNYLYSYCKCFDSIGDIIGDILQSVS